MTLTNKYIILKRNKAVVPTMENLGMRARPTDAFAEAPDSLELVEAELTIANRNDLRKDPRTRAIALPMPMKLIAPVKSQDVSAHEAQEIAWGIRAVGALESPFDGAGITAAVLDTGIDPNHPAFNGVQLGKILAAEFLDNPVGPDPVDRVLAGYNLRSGCWQYPHRRCHRCPARSYWQGPGSRRRVFVHHRPSHPMGGTGRRACYIHVLGDRFPRLRGLPG